jgi:hypothetical protein
MSRLRWLGWVILLAGLVVLGWQAPRAEAAETELVPVNALCLDQILPADARVGYMADAGENQAEFTWLQYHLVPRIFEQRAAGDCAGLDWVVLRGFDPAGVDAIAQSCGMATVGVCGAETALRRGK